MSEYIRTNKFDTNECPNIFVKEKLIRTNVRIYIRDQCIRIFEYSNIFVTRWFTDIFGKGKKVGRWSECLFVAKEMVSEAITTSTWSTFKPPRQKNVVCVPKIQKILSSTLCIICATCPSLHILMKTYLQNGSEIILLVWVHWIAETGCEGFHYYCWYVKN